MHLTDTRITHGPGGWQVSFVSDDGDVVTVHLACGDINAEQALERARAAMVQLTAFGTRGGGRSINPYDAASNGDFNVEEPLLVTRH